MKIQSISQAQEAPYARSAGRTFPTDRRKPSVSMLPAQRHVLRHLHPKPVGAKSASGSGLAEAQATRDGARNSCTHTSAANCGGARAQLTQALAAPRSPAGALKRQRPAFLHKEPKRVFPLHALGRLGVAVPVLGAPPCWLWSKRVPQAARAASA